MRGRGFRTTRHYLLSPVKYSCAQEWEFSREWDSRENPTGIGIAFGLLTETGILKINND